MPPYLFRQDQLVVGRDAKTVQLPAMFDPHFALRAHDVARSQWPRLSSCGLGIAIVGLLHLLSFRVQWSVALCVVGNKTGAGVSAGRPSP